MQVRKLFLILILLTPLSLPGQTIGCHTVGATCTVTVDAGQTILVDLQAEGGVGFSGLTDNGSPLTSTILASTTAAGGITDSLYSIPNASIGAHVLTGTGNSGNTQTGILAELVAGTVDSVTTLSTSGYATATCKPITTTVPNEVVVTFIDAPLSAVYATQSGFTLQAILSNNGGAMGAATVAAPGSYDALWTFYNGDTQVCNMVSIAPEVPVTVPPASTPPATTTTTTPAVGSIAFSINLTVNGTPVTASCTAVPQ